MRFLLNFLACAFAATQFFSAQFLVAQGNWRIGGGNAIPIDRLTNVFNPDKFSTAQGSLYHLTAQAQELGWNGILRYSANIVDNTEWTFFTGLYHFTNPNVLITEPTKPNAGYYWATVSQNIIPIGTGIEQRILNLWFIHGYVAADVAYNVFLPRSLEAISAGVQANDSDALWFGRGGASVGVGMDMMFWTFGVDASLRYHVVNLLGRAENEAFRSFVTLNFSLVFGEKR